MKSEVRNLAKSMGVNQEIVDAAPTDGLWEDHRTDEEQVGASYEELEWAMEYDGNINSLGKREREVLEIYNKFHNQNKHKMIDIPIFKNNFDN
jgi:NAD+ synthase